MIRALALRALVKCLADKDTYVAKTASIAVVKLYSHVRNGQIEKLRQLLKNENSMVVANAVAALTEIAEKTPEFDMRMDFTLSNKLVTAMNECSEWGQVYILESLLYFVPQDHADAVMIAERVMPRLQHANSAVVLSAIRVVLYMTNYILKDEIVNSFFKLIGSPLVTLLHNGSEVQYNEIKVFFCKYNDPIYVKIAKLEIMFRLVNDENIEQVLPDLKEYATEVDADFVRKSIRAIGKCAIKISSSADRRICTLGIITTLCENLDSLDESEAKASMIWIIGHYSDRIENADELLDHFMDGFKDETPNVQLSLLTAVVKLFIKRPTKGQELIPKILKWSTEDVDNPDLRDRGFIYWRLLSTDPVVAKAIVFGDSAPINAEMENLPTQTLEELFLHISTLASIYHKTPETFIGGLRQKKVEPSAAFVFRDFSAYGRHLDGGVFAQNNKVPSSDGLFGDDSRAPVNPYTFGMNIFEETDDNEDVDEEAEAVISPVIADAAPIDSIQFDMFLNSLRLRQPRSHSHNHLLMLLRY
ncbi:UNVERIFIED_CONTAM: hypothetical protein HDU68_006494 [Siphonaria sp. JEL0065]|nr:hypothetical protein HDU68_006494 [Siphonaria sp. JEL0065]